VQGANRHKAAKRKAKSNSMHALEYDNKKIYNIQLHIGQE